MKIRVNKIPLLILVFILIITVFLPFIKPIINEVMNRDFIDEVKRLALPANIKIVQLNYSTGYNSSSISVSAGASGVIFRKEGNRYFALTALHVISELRDVDKTQTVVLGYDDKDFEKENLGTGIAEYYLQFPEIEVDYKSEKYDLAIISFVSDKVYNVLSLSDEKLHFWDKVASMSNPFGERNIMTAGRLGSRKIWHYEDEIGKFDYTIIKHSAVTSQGSSGSALLNEDMEIVGINLGGNENFFRQFISGMAIPNEQIQEFLREWNK
jgi:S1-C subfamily serine protease